jgi:hypothetical protein
MTFLGSWDKFISIRIFFNQNMNLSPDLEFGENFYTKIKGLE